MPLIPTPNYNRLQEIRLVEKRSLLFNGFLTSVTIDTTAQWASSKWYKVPKNVSEKKFHPSFFRSTLIIIFIILFSGLFYLLITHSQSGLSDTLFPMAITIFFISFLVYNGFLDKKKNYTILINSEGISLGDDSYRWNELKETAILQVGAGRSESAYLVLLFQDNSYKKYSTRNFLTFWGFKNALSTYIEYFKNNSVT